MTELEKMLKDTLTRMEQDLTATQRSQGHSLNSQQHIHANLEPLLSRLSGILNGK